METTQTTNRSLQTGAETMSKFTVNPTTGAISGPADYMASDSYQETRRKVETGTHVLIAAAPAGTPIGTLIEVIFQTDYAAWKGMQAFTAV